MRRDQIDHWKLQRTESLHTCPGLQPFEAEPEHRFRRFSGVKKLQSWNRLPQDFCCIWPVLHTRSAFPWFLQELHSFPDKNRIFSPSETEGRKRFQYVVSDVQKGIMNFNMGFAKIQLTQKPHTHTLTHTTQNSLVPGLRHLWNNSPRVRDGSKISQIRTWCSSQLVSVFLTNSHHKTAETRTTFLPNKKIFFLAFSKTSASVLPCLGHTCLGPARDAHIPTRQHLPLSRVKQKSPCYFKPDKEEEIN